MPSTFRMTPCARSSRRFPQCRAALHRGRTELAQHVVTIAVAAHIARVDRFAGRRQLPKPPQQPQHPIADHTRTSFETSASRTPPHLPAGAASPVCARGARKTPRPPAPTPRAPKHKHPSPTRTATAPDTATTAPIAGTAPPAAPGPPATPPYPPCAPPRTTGRHRAPCTKTPPLNRCARERRRRGQDRAGQENRTT